MPLGLKEIRIFLKYSTLRKKLKLPKQGLKIYWPQIGGTCAENLHEDFVDEDTGSGFHQRNEILDRDTVLEKEHIDEIIDSGTKTILLHKEDNLQADYAVSTTHCKKTYQLRKSGEHIYRQLRNAEPPDEETARGIIHKLFFSDQDIILVR